MRGATAGRLRIAGAALLFSTGGAAIKAAGLSAIQIACFRAGLAALVLALFTRVWRRRFPPRVWAVGAAFATVMVLFVVSNRLTTAAHSIFLQSTAPLYVLWLAPRLLGEPRRASDSLVGAAILMGVVLLFAGAGAPLSTAPRPVVGNLIALTNGAFWAAAILGLRALARTASSEYDPALDAAIAGNALACLVCLPFALPVTDSAGIDWLVMGYLGVFQVAVAYVFMTRGTRTLPAVEVSLILLIEPMLNPVWAWWLHGEGLNGFALAGCATILVATIARALRGD